MNSIAKRTMNVSLVASLLIGFNSCENFDSPGSQVAYTQVLDVSSDGTSSVLESELKSVLYDAPVLETSDEDLLLYMKDEEKLAHDVYVALNEKWNLTIFANIQNAEQKHLDAILYLIQNYTTTDGTIGAQGEFDNPDFTTLYQQLVERGSQSITEALTVGALIEELDINDLTQYLTQTTNENMILVFENLLKGSRNHLRAFNNQLVILGVTYQPQYLDQTTFDEIINSSFEKGNRYAKRNRGQKGKGNGNGDGSCAY